MVVELASDGAVVELVGGICVVDETDSCARAETAAANALSLIRLHRPILSERCSALPDDERDDSSAMTTPREQMTAPLELSLPAL